jgi:CheY-like chemotaxis protein
VRDFLEYLLRDLGYQVELAKDGAGALALLAEGEYGVVLMDHLMPGMSGQEVGREIVLRYPGLPVILVTGAVSVDPDEMQREGFFRVLAKPCKADDIIDAVKAAVGS